MNDETPLYWCPTIVRISDERFRSVAAIKRGTLALSKARIARPNLTIAATSGILSSLGKVEDGDQWRQDAVSDWYSLTAADLGHRFAAAREQQRQDGLPDPLLDKAAMGSLRNSVVIWLGKCLEHVIDPEAFGTLLVAWDAPPEGFKKF